MTLCLNSVRLICLTIVVRQISAENSTDSTTVQIIHNNSTNDFTNIESPVTVSSIQPIENTLSYDFDTILLNNITSQKSQERISSHSKRGASLFPSHNPYFPYHHHHQHHHHQSHPPHNLLHRHPRSFLNSKSRRKPRRYRKKPGNLPPPSITKMLPQYMKPSHQRPPNKPVLFSEMLRAMNPYGPAKIKAATPFMKDYIEEDDLETMPFSSIDSVDSYPPAVFGRFSARPPSPIDIHEDIHDALPPPMEEIIIPANVNMRPFASTVRRPPTGPMTSVAWPSKPSSMYIDEEFQDSVPSLRVAKPHQHNDYIDKDILKLLTKIKSEGLNSDTKSGHDEQQPAPAKENKTEINAAIAKLLSPFLSQSAVKQIQSYFNRLPADKQQDERNVTKVVYIIENESKDGNDSSLDGQYKSYSISEPLHDTGTNNTTYFIMVKSPESNLITSNSSTSQLFRKFTQSNSQRLKQPEIRTTVPPSPESIALQNYIMSLAGIDYSPAHYLPHFNSFQKSLRNL